MKILIFIVVGIAAVRTQNEIVAEQQTIRAYYSLFRDEISLFISRLIKKASTRDKMVKYIADLVNFFSAASGSGIHSSLPYRPFI